MTEPVFGSGLYERFKKKGRKKKKKEKKIVFPQVQEKRKSTVFLI